LLVRGDTLLVLDLGLDVVDGVGGLDLKGDGLARKAISSAPIMVVHMSIHIHISSSDLFLSFLSLRVPR
jgi:hypothetical protein